MTRDIAIPSPDQVSASCIVQQDAFWALWRCGRARIRNGRSSRYLGHHVHRGGELMQRQGSKDGMSGGQRSSPDAAKHKVVTPERLPISR